MSDPATASVAREPAEWGATPAIYPARKRFVVVELLLVPALAVGIVGFLLWGFAGLLLSFVAAVVALLVWALVLRPPLRPLHPRAPRPDEVDRFLNLLQGLAGDLGRSSPRVLVIDSDEANAYVARRMGTSIVGVTTGLITDLPRTEQEAVAAHCLVRLGSPSLRYSMIAVATGKWAYAHAPGVGGPDDLAAVAITRYPPALAAAIGKAGTSVAEAPLAFCSGAACHRPPETRRAALLDL